MHLTQATHYANLIKKGLAPYCEKIEIAGSIRRQKPQGIKDVEIVAIPKTSLQKVDMFTEQELRVPELVQKLAQPNTGELVKGDPIAGKYLQYKGLWGHVTLDLFFVTPDTWGKQMLIRTGPWEFGQALFARLKAFGYRNQDGKTFRGTDEAPCPTEQTVFDLVNLPWCPPEQRTKEWIRQYDYIPANPLANETPI